MSVNIQPSTLATLNNGNIVSTTGSTKYHIQVETTSKDGTERLTGRTVSFNIAPTSAFQKRNDDAVLSVDGAAISEVASPVDGAANPEVALSVDGSTVPEVVDVNNGEGVSPAAVAISPAVSETPIDVPISVANPPSSISSSSVLAAIPSPTYPNVPLEITDPSIPVPNTTGPNQAAPGDPATPKVIQEPKKKPSSGEVFLKYAGAGSAILSTIGLGLGGLVGGAVGGAVGLVIGVAAALVNSLYYAPNVA